jgi:hypothetical protein
MPFNLPGPLQAVRPSSLWPGPVPKWVHPAHQANPLQHTPEWACSDRDATPNRALILRYSITTSSTVQQEAASMCAPCRPTPLSAPHLAPHNHWPLEHLPPLLRTPPHLCLKPPAWSPPCASEHRHSCLSSSSAAPMPSGTSLTPAAASRSPDQPPPPWAGHHHPGAHWLLLWHQRLSLQHATVEHPPPPTDRQRAGVEGQPRCAYPRLKPQNGIPARWSCFSIESGPAHLEQWGFPFTLELVWIIQIQIPIF